MNTIVKNEGLDYDDGDDYDGDDISSFFLFSDNYNCDQIKFQNAVRSR